MSAPKTPQEKEPIQIGTAGNLWESVGMIWTTLRNLAGTVAQLWLFVMLLIVWITVLTLDRILWIE